MPATTPRRRGVYWVTVGPTPYYATCQRCGGHVPMPVLPCPIPAFVAYSKYAEALHKDCRPVPAGASQ